MHEAWHDIFVVIASQDVGRNLLLKPEFLRVTAIWLTYRLEISVAMAMAMATESEPEPDSRYARAPVPCAAYPFPCFFGF